MIRASDKTIYCWAMGITQHAHGVANVFAIVNLALAQGNPNIGLIQNLYDMFGRGDIDADGLPCRGRHRWRRRAGTD